MKRRTNHEGGDKVWVTFRFAGVSGANVYVAGTFNNWNPTEFAMKEEPNGHYRETVRLAEGRYEYKFIVNGQWQNCPVSQDKIPNPLGSTNNVLVVSHAAEKAQGHPHTFSKSPPASSSGRMWGT